MTGTLGSVGLGVAQTLFASLTQDYLRARGWGASAPEGKMIALLGDAEMDEGNIFEALLEGWKQPERAAYNGNHGLLIAKAEWEK